MAASISFKRYSFCSFGDRFDSFADEIFTETSFFDPDVSISISLFSADSSEGFSDNSDFKS